MGKSLLSQDPDRPLTHQMQAWVNAFCTTAGWNAFDACKEAKYKGADASLKVQAHRLLTNVRVRRAIEKKKQEIYGAQEATMEEVRASHRLAMAQSLKKGDLVNYSRNTEDLGKTLGAYIDRSEQLTAQIPLSLDEQEAYHKSELEKLRKARAVEVDYLGSGDCIAKG